MFESQQTPARWFFFYEAADTSLYTRLRARPGDTPCTTTLAASGTDTEFASRHTTSIFTSQTQEAA